MNFNIVKTNYERGLWSKIMVRICVQKGIITEEEYEQITGEKYS